MGDFLQLSVKRRRKDGGGFLDLLKEDFKRGCKGDPQNPGATLRERVRTWLVEEKLLGESPHDPVNPIDIVDAIMNRVCEIAGHAWIEFVEGAGDDSIRGAGEARREMINAYVAEFIPAFDLDHIFETFEATGGGQIPWHQITNEQLCTLFAPLLAESDVNRTPNPSTDRQPAGAVPGYHNLISPEQLREQGDAWFRDRQQPYVTPVWEADAPPLASVDSISVASVGLRYSYTPEHYDDAENCVTWASRLLDSLAPGDWLETIRAQCVMSPELAPERCEAYHIKEHGRMRCAEEYVSLADAQREVGLRRFS